MEARTQQSVLAFDTGIHLCPELEALAKICYICDFGVATKFLVKIIIIVNSNYIYRKFLLTLSIILNISLGTD